MPQSESQLKGGHPPAVKAGGMRISQHKPEKETVPAVVTDGDEQIKVEEPKNQIKQIINGVVAKGDADFPAEAVKAFHDNKPQPMHEYRPKNNISAKVIQQPKKM